MSPLSRWIRKPLPTYTHAITSGANCILRKYLPFSSLTQVCPWHVAWSIEHRQDFICLFLQCARCPAIQDDCTPIVDYSILSFFNFVFIRVRYNWSTCLLAFLIMVTLPLEESLFPLYPFSWHLVALLLNIHQSFIS